MADGEEPTESARPPLDPFLPDPHPRYEVRAADLLRTFVEPDDSEPVGGREPATTKAPIVEVEDAYITGVFDLRAADLPYLFRFVRCRFEQPPDVRNANLVELVFRRCWLPGLEAGNLRTHNDLQLIRSVVRAGADSPGTKETSRYTARDERGSPAAVNLIDATIGGSLVLSGTRISNPGGNAVQADRLVVTGALIARRLETRGEVGIAGLRAGGDVSFSGATLDNPESLALNGSDLRVGGSLRCDFDSVGSRSRLRRFSARGILFMPRLRVVGDIVFRGARLEVDQVGDTVADVWKSGDWYLGPRPALIADRMRVDGNVELSDQFDVTGSIRMLNAHLGGALRLADARVRVPQGPSPNHHAGAIQLDGSTIDGGIDSRDLRIVGQLRLPDVSVRGDVVIRNADVFHPRCDAISFRRSTVSGNFLLTDSTVAGSLRLQGMNVGGSIDLRGTEALQPEVTGSSWSVDLRSVQVGDSINITTSGDRRFYAAGGVTVAGANVAQRMDFSGAVLESLPEHGIALDASGAGAAEFELRPDAPPTGEVVLRRARCGKLSDTPALWQATGGIRLEDFSYDTLDIPIDPNVDTTVRTRLALLHDAMDGYRPGPYDQLAEILRAHGHERQAGTVQLKKQQFRYEALAHGSRLLGGGIWFWSWLQRSMVGYGYRPSRAFGWLVVLLGIAVSAGALVAAGTVGRWLLLVTVVVSLVFLLALFTAAVHRRGERLSVSDRSGGSRSVTSEIAALRHEINRLAVVVEQQHIGGRDDEVIEGALVVDAYLDIDDFVTARAVLSALDHMASVLGFERPEWEQLQRGSWWRRAKAALGRAVASEELATRLIKVERAIEVATLDRQQAEVDVRSAEAVAQLLAALQDVPQACLRVGSIMIVKYPGDSGPIVLSRNLSQLEIAALERFPEIQKKPRQALDALAIAITTIQSDSEDDTLW